MKNNNIIANIIGFSALLIYSLLFLLDISPYWFSPDWITDDAMQQVYQFHDVYNPGIFQGDIITQSMNLYLAPLHYWMAYGITIISKDPIIMAHWMMLIQVALTVLFIFLTINLSAGFFPACLGALWFLHSGILIQRLSGGLPRGWISPLVAIYLYLVAGKKHFLILLTLLLACLLNSLAAFILIASYGFYLVIKILCQSNRKEYLKTFLYFCLACPLYLLVTYKVIERPENIGKMVSYQEALQMPSLTKEGRFKIAPLPPVLSEFESQSMQIFAVYYHKTFNKLRKYSLPIVFSLIFIICLIAYKNKIAPMPGYLFSFILAVTFCYSASRLLAFNLYVPNRYLRFPVSIFFICFFIISLWRIFPKRIYSYLSYLLLGSYVFLGTGSGLQREAGYNYKKSQDGQVFEWIKNNTPLDSTIAGYPNFVDPLPLFAMRKVYISNETAHPFYDKYYEFVKHRLNVTLKAHYAKNLADFLKALEGEKIDYFIFERRKFKTNELKKATYFAPFDELIKTLTSGDSQKYVFFEMLSQAESQPSWLKFTDSKAMLIDVNELKKSLN